MALGSLLDAGADVDEVRGLLDRLALPGWDLRVEDGHARRHRLHAGGRRAATTWSVRTHGAIAALIEDAALPPRVAAARPGRLRLAGRGRSPPCTGDPVDEVHFHEVGGHDAIVDIVGTAAALEVLGVDEVSASAVATGNGTVRSAHGWLPNPAPATVRLLEGVPTYGRDVPIELTTPTGAALLATLCSSFGPLPDMTITRVGLRRGRRRDGRPAELHPGGGRPAADVAGRSAAASPPCVLETNLDDVTGEQLGYAVAAALDAGAFDAWVSPVTMKKGRPGHVLHVLTDAGHADALRDEIERVTGTMGVRATAVERWPRRPRDWARSWSTASPCG